MKKLRVFVDMKKEEQYLKGMAEQGWGLVKYSTWNMYTFEKMAPKDLNYRIDFQIFRKKADYVEYLTLFADSGWHHISGSQNSGYQFFLPGSNQNQYLDIFSDVASSNQRYKRLYSQATFWGTLMFVYFILFQPSFQNLSSWYLTSTIWEYTGLQLIGMIIMETFFMALQILPIIFFMTCAIYYAVIGTKAKELMKKNAVED